MKETKERERQNLKDLKLNANNVNPSWEDMVAIRQECNLKILDIIRNVVYQYPDLRFWQIMYMFGYETIPDRFYDRSLY